MSFGAPWALAALLAIPALWWLHRRARPRGDRPFALFYLLDGEGGEGHGRRRPRAPWLMAARIAAVAALAVGGAGLVWNSSPGTLVLCDGPVVSSEDWVRPITFVRAGQPPSLAAEVSEITPVIGRRDWGGAYLLGRRHAPDATVVRAKAPHAAPQIVGAGASLAGVDAVVAAQVLGGVPSVWIGGRRQAMTRQGDTWMVVGQLPSGPAEVRLGDERWPVCVPDTRPLKVAGEGWPVAVEAVLAVLPHVARVPKAEANWHVSAGAQRIEGWAAFAPARTAFTFSTRSNRGVAPLSFVGHLPPPGAIVRRWAALEGLGEALLLAAGQPVVDVGTGPAGRSRRFGFAPKDTDLPKTGGWPVLFAEMVEADRVARGRCRVHEAGRPLTVVSEREVTVLAPDGTARALRPVAGRVVVDGLDVQGIYRLESGGVQAAVAVVPPERDVQEPSDVQHLGVVAEVPPVHRALPLALALLLGVALPLLSRRARAPLGWLVVGVVALALSGPELGGGTMGPVVVAVDVSGSQSQALVAARTAQVEAALGDAPKFRVEGDDAVRRSGALTGPPILVGGGTRHGPLVSAAQILAGDGGVVVLVTDGRARDGPVPSRVPVFVVPAGLDGTDGRIEGARAVRVGTQVFVRAQVSASAATAARLHMGPVALSLDLGTRPTTARAVLPASVAGAEVSLRLVVSGDPVNGNNQRPVPVEGARSGEAVVVGASAAPWAEAAGLPAHVLPADALLEAGSRLAMSRALFVHDQPSLPAALLPHLKRWLQAGGVMLLAGRRGAFGPGGWAGTPLEALSPLRADPRPAGGGALGVTLLLDRSGSMAREAGGIGSEGVATLAGALAAGLGVNDQLAVVAFAQGAETLMPATAVGRVAETRLVVPSITRGGTRLLPGLRAAAAALRHAEVEARVVLLVSDGRFADAPGVAVEAAAFLKASGLRLVVVLTGEMATDVLLGPLAVGSGGVVMALNDGEDAPRVAVAAVHGGAAGLLVPGGEVAVGPAWGTRVGGVAPAVAARVRVSARASARVLARVGGEPLLAEWAVGAGRVIALATDTWALSEDQWAALLSPAAAPRPGEVSVYEAGGVLVLRGDPLASPPAGGVYVKHDAGEQRVPWRLRRPGIAWAPLPAGPVEVLEASSSSPTGAVSARFTRPPPTELLKAGLDRGALALQAALTGGDVLSDPSDMTQVLAARGRRGGAPLAPWLALLAALLLLVETAVWAGTLSFVGERQSIARKILDSVWRRWR